MTIDSPTAKADEAAAASSDGDTQKHRESAGQSMVADAITVQPMARRGCRRCHGCADRGGVPTRCADGS